MKERKNTEVVVRNYYCNGESLDFTIELITIERDIKRHKVDIEFAEKYNLETDSDEGLPNLISNLHTVKDTLRGRFDVLVINGGWTEKE